MNSRQPINKGHLAAALVSPYGDALVARFIRLRTLDLARSYVKQQRSLLRLSNGVNSTRPLSTRPRCKRRR